MAWFRKRPVVIEAWEFAWEGLPMPAWLVAALDSGAVSLISGGLSIATLEGTMTASVGDWIIKGVQGEIYPCKPDIFAETYEPVDDRV